MGKYMTAEQRRSADIARARIERTLKSRARAATRVAALFKISEAMDRHARQVLLQRDRAPIRRRLRLGLVAAQFERIEAQAVVAAFLIDSDRAIERVLAKLPSRRVRRRDKMTR
jgi:hypothetical protein